MRYWHVNLNRLTKVLFVFPTIFIASLLMGRLPASAQMVYWVDQFDPSGTSGYSYSSGQITSVWGNWFGDAFQSLSWDPSNDASNNPASGALKINLNFNNSGASRINLRFSTGLTPSRQRSMAFNIQIFSVTSVLPPAPPRSPTEASRPSAACNLASPLATTRIILVASMLPPPIQIGCTSASISMPAPTPICKISAMC